MLHTNRSLVDGGSGQINIDMALKNANAKLSQWTTKWEHEMRRGERQHYIFLPFLNPSTANGESFHFAFLNFFCLYSSLFLNSFGVQADAAPASCLPTITLVFSHALFYIGKPDQ